MMKEQAKKKNAPGLIDLADAYVAPAFTNLRTDLVGFGEALDAQSILMDMARELDEEGAQDAVSIIDPLEDLPRGEVEESEADLEGALNALGSKAPKEPGGDDDHSGEAVAATGAAAAVAAGAVLAAEGQEETQADAAVEAQTDDQTVDPLSGDADLSAVPEVSAGGDIPEFQGTQEMPELPSQEAGQDNDLAGFDDEEGSEEAGSATDEWAVEDLGDVDVADEDQDASVDEEAILADDVLKEDEWPEATELELDNDLEEADAAAANNHVVSSSEGFLQAAGDGAKKEGDEEPASVALSEIFASEDDEFSTELGPELKHGAKAWSDPDDEADLNVAQSAEPASEQALSDVSDVIDQKEDIPSSAEDAIWSAETAEATDAPASEKPAPAAAEAKPAWQSMYENPPVRPAVVAAATAAPAMTQDEIRLSGNQTADDAAEDAGSDNQGNEDGKASVDTVIATEQGNGGGNRLAGDAPSGSSGKGKGRSFIIAALTAGLLAGGASYAWVKRDTVKQYVPALAGLLDKIEQAQAQNGQAAQPPASTDGEKADPDGTGAVKPAGDVDISIDLSDNGQLPSNQPFTRRAVDEEAARAKARNGAGAGNEADAAAAARAEIDRIAGVNDAKDNRVAAAAAEEQAPDQTKALLKVQGKEIRRLEAEIDVLKAEMVKINSIADNTNRQANSMASALVDISRLGEESAANDMRLVELTGRVARVELNDPGSVARQSAEKAAGTAVSRIEQRLDDLSADIGIVARMAVKNNANPFGGGDNADLLPLRAAPSVDSEPSPERFSRPSHEAPRISDSPDQARAAATPGRRTGRSKYPETISPRKTFTISNNDASRVSRVQRGDFVDGYGYVLEIKPVKGGGRMVIMENGSVYVE